MIESFSISVINLKYYEVKETKLIMPYNFMNDFGDSLKLNGLYSTFAFFSLILNGAKLKTSKQTSLGKAIPHMLLTQEEHATRDRGD